MNTGLSDARWFKSSHSGGDKECVEVAFLPGGSTGIRDSKDPSGPALIVAPAQWDAFIADAAAGTIDHP